MPLLNLPNTNSTAAGVKIADVLYALEVYTQYGKKVLILITNAGPIAIPATNANVSYLKGLGINISSLSPPTKKPAPTRPRKP